YENADDVLLNPNPVILDENGWGSVSIVGAYRLRQYDKKGVFVGDQDFKRPPAKVLTSVVYPIYFKEDLSTSFDVCNAKIEKILNQEALSETIETEFTVLSPVRIDSIIYSDYLMKPESVLTGFQALSPVRVDTVIYSKYNLGGERVATVLSVANPVRQVVLLQHTMEHESVSTRFSVLNPVRN